MKKLFLLSIVVFVYFHVKADSSLSPSSQFEFKNVVGMLNMVDGK